MSPLLPHIQRRDATTDRTLTHRHHWPFGDVRSVEGAFQVDAFTKGCSAIFNGLHFSAISPDNRRLIGLQHIYCLELDGVSTPLKGIAEARNWL